MCVQYCDTGGRNSNLWLVANPWPFKIRNNYYKIFYYYYMLCGGGGTCMCVHMHMCMHIIPYTRNLPCFETSASPAILEKAILQKDN